MYDVGETSFSIFILP